MLFDSTRNLELLSANHFRQFRSLTFATNNRAYQRSYARHLTRKMCYHPCRAKSIALIFWIGLAQLTVKQNPVTKCHQEQLFPAVLTKNNATVTDCQNALPQQKCTLKIESGGLRIISQFGWHQFALIIVILCGNHYKAGSTQSNSQQNRTTGRKNQSLCHLPQKTLTNVGLWCCQTRKFHTLNSVTVRSRYLLIKSFTLLEPTLVAGLLKLDGITVRVTYMAPARVLRALLKIRITGCM